MALPTAPQIAPLLLTRSFIYLKDKQIEVIHENSKNLNQTKLIFRHALGNARYRGEKQYWLFIHQSNSKNVITVRIFIANDCLKLRNRTKKVGLLPIYSQSHQESQ